MVAAGSVSNFNFKNFKVKLYWDYWSYYQRGGTFLSDQIGADTVHHCRNNIERAFQVQ